jgi:hypothetical protein
MRFIAILLFYFFGWFISVPFDSFEATQQKSFGGRAKSGSTVHYQFKMVSKVSSDKFELKGLWIGIEKVDFKMYSLNAEKQQQKTFQRGDTIYVDAYVHSRPDENGNLVSQGINSVPPPIEYTGLGLLKYDYKGKTKYHIIEEIKKLPNVYYP